MAAFDFDKIKNVIQAAGYGTDTQSVTAINEAITAAWLEIASEREWSFLEARSTAGSTTIGSEVLTLPADIVAPKHVRIATTSESHTLQQVDARTLQDRLDADTPASTGVPIEWAWVRQTVLVWPRPDRVYTVALEYVRSPDPADFDADNEAFPFIDDRFAPLIAWAAIRWLAFKNRDQVSYALAKGEYESAKQNLSASDRRGEPDHVVEWDGWRNLPGYAER